MTGKENETIVIGFYATQSHQTDTMAVFDTRQHLTRRKRGDEREHIHKCFPQNWKNLTAISMPLKPFCVNVIEKPVALKRSSNANSNEDNGTVFTFSLPVSPPSSSSWSLRFKFSRIASNQMTTGHFSSANERGWPWRCVSLLEPIERCLLPLQWPLEEGSAYNKLQVKP